MAQKINFLGGLVTTFREEYEERRKFKELINDSRLVDVWYDNYGYGFRNSKFEPVILSDDSSIIKNFNGFADSVGALNFVADAFIAFRDDFIEKINSSTIGYPSFLEGMVPVKGYGSFEDLFSNWSAYSSTKYAASLQENKKISNYSGFLDEINHVFVQNLHKFPITKSEF